MACTLACVQVKASSAIKVCQLLLVLEGEAALLATMDRLLKRKAWVGVWDLRQKAHSALAVRARGVWTVES